MPGTEPVSDTELIRAVLAGSPVRIAVLDREGRYVLDPDPNPPLASDHGAPPGANFLDLYGDVPGLVAGMRSAFSGEENHLIREVGGSTYVLHITPRRNSRGVIDAAIVVATVLAHETVAQQALAELQVRERRVFHSNMTGLLYWDAAGAITDANDAFLALVGYTREDLLLGRVNWLSMTPSEYLHLDHFALDEIRASGYCTPFEKEYVRKDGQRVAVLIGASSWELGAKAGVAVVVDISERKRHERERGEAEAHLRRVVDGAPVVAWSIDAAGIFTLSIGRGLRAMGLVPGEVVGRSVFDVYAAEPTVLAALRRGLAGEEFSNTMPVGDLIFDTLFTPLRDQHGVVNGLLGVSIDVTERHRAELQREQLRAQLLQAQKLESLGLLAGGVAHDFNNILSVVLGGAATALGALPADSPARQDIESVILAAERAAGLTHQMLAYAGKTETEVRTIDISTHVRDIAGLIGSAVSKKVDLRLLLEPRLPAIEADITQIQQILMNLVINAAEAIGDQPGIIRVKSGVVTLDAEQARARFAAEGFGVGRYVFLEVHDSGPGMDEPTKGRIFDPFFTTKFAGRGLGLAAVHGIVRAHFGAIRVESSPGRGSTFSVFFPTSSKQEHENLRGTPLAFSGSGRVLVVDDDDAVRMTVCRMLKLFGFCVIEAPNGRRGAETFAQHAAELALAVIDMTMPEMNGEETFVAIRGLRPDVPIVLMSGYDERDTTRRLLEQGRAAFLRKPFTPAELAGKLAEVLRAQ